MNDDTPTVLIVDDQPENLAVLAALLQPHFRVRAARSGEQALRAAATVPAPDLVLLDIMMPAMDGFEVLARLRELPGLAQVPVLFVTALDAEPDEERGLALGAVDYIAKPIKPSIVLARVRTHLELKRARDRLRDQNAALEGLVAERTAALDASLRETEAAHAQLKKTYFDTLVALGELGGLRDGAIADHHQRVARLARLVATRLGLAEAEAQEVFIAALLHDIGKVGFPDELLRRPVNAMSREENGAWQKHVLVGEAFVARLPALAGVARLIRSHHELFNGEGFPDHLGGLHIPLGARILCAVSDYEDLKAGMLATRPLSARQSGQYLVDCAGSRYDPGVVEALEPIISMEGRYEIDEMTIDATNLQEGMVLTREVRDHNDTVLLAKGTVMTRGLIDQLAAFASRAKRSLKVQVRRTPAK